MPSKSYKVVTIDTKGIAKKGVVDHLNIIKSEMNKSAKLQAQLALMREDTRSIPEYRIRSLQGRIKQIDDWVSLQINWLIREIPSIEARIRVCGGRTIDFY